MKIALVLLAGVMLALAYVLYVRPALERAGIVGQLSPERSGLRDRLAAYVANSWTMAWQMLIGFVSSVFTVVLGFAETLGMPDVKAQVVSVFKDYPEAVSGGFLLVAIVTAIARMRSMKS